MDDHAYPLVFLAAQGAQAPEILWSIVNSGGAYATVPMGDITGDGMADLVPAIPAALSPADPSVVPV